MSLSNTRKRAHINNLTLVLHYLNLCFFFKIIISLRKLLCLCCFHSKTPPENTRNKTRVFRDTTRGKCGKQACAKLLTSLLQVCLQQPACYSIVRTTLLQDRQQVATSPLEQAVTSSANTTCHKQCEHNLLTSRWNSTVTSLLRVFYKLCVFTCVHEVMYLKNDLM